MELTRKPNELAQLIHAARTIALCSHVNPDGDTVGSVLALKLGLEKLGKQVSVFCQDKIPSTLDMLPGVDAYGSESSERFDLLIAVDVSDVSRMGSCAFLLQQAQRTAQIDHHGTNPCAMQVNSVDEHAPATALLIKEQLDVLGVAIDREIAMCLYAGISTDTGNFNYKNTDVHAFNSAAECVKYGAQVEPLTKKVYRERSLACTLLLGEALMRVRTAADGKIAYTYVNNEMLEKTGAKLEDASRIANYLNEVAGAVVGVSFEQQSDNTKISWRSAGGLHVADIAKAFNGGGHDAAAGANLKMTMEEAIEAVLAKTEEAVKGFEA